MERVRCHFKDSLIDTLCPTMEAALRDKDSKSGMYILNMTNMKTMERTRDVIAYKNADIKEGKKKNGMIMNFCPFCGSLLFTPKKGTLVTHATREEEEA